MTKSSGLSIGVTNLVAARAGRPRVVRRSVLTLFDHRPPAVGAPDENPKETGTGLVVRGFVERVGDPLPLIAADGSTLACAELVVDALDAMARTVGNGAPATVAVPAHWSADQLQAMRAALCTKPLLAPEGALPGLVSDDIAALAALSAKPGLPSDGVVALCDFGGSGTSITLVDAASGCQPIAATVRYPALSGDHIDLALLNYVFGVIRDAGYADPAATAAVTSLTRQREECRRAKERLSAAASTVVAADLPGFSGDVRLSRRELENIIAQPLDGFINEVVKTLQRNKVSITRLSAVAAVGGGANIPLILEKLSQRLQAPVVSTPQPALSAAVGATMLAGQLPSAGVVNGDSGADDADDAPTNMNISAAAHPATGMSTDEAEPAAFPALAWSQDDSATSEPVPYTRDDDATGHSRRRRKAGRKAKRPHGSEPAPQRWYKRPSVLFGVAATIVLLSANGLAYTLISNDTITDMVTSSVTAPRQPPAGPALQPAVPPLPVTTTGWPPNAAPTTTPPTSVSLTPAPAR